jgi:predicted DNA-binding transcriptional regulator AlpA
MSFDGSIWECKACGRWFFPHADPDRQLDGDAVAWKLGISRRTLYRWVEEGRIPPAPWRESTIAPLVGRVTKRQRGPKRNPRAIRYTTGRHRFDEVRIVKKAS